MNGEERSSLDDVDEEMGFSTARLSSRQRSTLLGVVPPSKELAEILNPSRDYLPSAMSKPLSKKLTENSIEIVKIGNVICSFVGWMYFLHLGYNDVVLEYCQICFLSILMNVLDSPNNWKRWSWLFVLTCSGVGWSMMTIYTICNGMPLYNIVSWSLMCIFYDAGSIAAAYVSLYHPSRNLKSASFLEIDLLLYLVSLNALCVFPITHFNTNLHMLLDIRMVVLLFTGLYRPIDKMALLRRKSFIFIILCILLFFILVANPGPYFQFAGSIVNIGVGMTLLVQSLYFYYVKYPRIRLAQDAEIAWEHEQLHAKQQNDLDREIRKEEAIHHNDVATNLSNKKNDRPASSSILSPMAVSLHS